MTHLTEGKRLGRLCKRGHEYNGTGKSVRYMSTNNCVDCQVVTAVEWRKNNRLRSNQLQANYRKRGGPAFKKKVSVYNNNYYFAVTKPNRQKAREENDSKNFK